MTTESHRTSARTWQVVANDPGGFAGEAVSIGYCVRSKKPVAKAAPAAPGAAPAAPAEITESELDEPAVEGVKAGGKEIIGTGRRRPVAPAGGARSGARR